MAKVKMTKTELKTQRDSLKQFTRFLPTLQLKKQQLQVEMRLSQARLRENEQKVTARRKTLATWLALFGDDPTTEKLKRTINFDGVVAGTANIAGVTVPVYEGVNLNISEYDLFEEDSWFDDAIEAVRSIIELNAEHEIIQEQYNLLAAELRSTTQRVNLFEKVKIPECKENIRRIQIYLGDQDTAGVARAKLAKAKSQEAAA
jgi:V/A-type H+/Na+-transporting ATPase subunit D